MINFQSDDWKHLVATLEKALENQRGTLESVSTTYKEKLIAIGDIKRIKTILNMPQNSLPPKDNNGNRKQ